MEKLTMTTERAPMYARNNGQQAEREARHALTGEWFKADNLKGGADCLGYQIKSARATVCRGDSLDNIATEYAGVKGFIFADREACTMYVMTAEEWRAFCERFAEVDRESKGNGVKLRLNRQNKAQRAYLERRTR